MPFTYKEQSPRYARYIKLVFSLVLVISFATGCIYVSKAIVGTVERYTLDVDHTRLVISDLEKLNSYFTSAQIYSRKLDSTTRSPLYHQYQADALALGTQVYRIRRLTIDNPEQTMLLDSISYEVDQEYSTLLEKNLSEIIQAGELFRLNAFDKIRSLIDQGIVNENRLLLIRQSTLEKTIEWLTLALSVIGFMVILSFLFMNFLLTRSRNLLQGFLGSVLDTSFNAILHYNFIRDDPGRAAFVRSYANRAAKKDRSLEKLSTVEAPAQGNTTAINDLLYTQFTQSLASGRPGKFEFDFGSGRLSRSFVASVARLKSGVTVSFQEVTELKEVNQKLQETNEELLRFIHVSSHDLKEPLRKMKLFLSRVVEADLSLMPEPAIRDLQKVDASADRAIYMIDAVNQYSSFQPQVFRPEKVDLSMVISSIQHDLEIVFNQTHSRLIVHSLPVVLGTEVLLHQLFYNLLINSVKFRSAGSTPAITIKSEPLAAAQLQALGLASDTAYHRITVSDNGIGFDQKDAASIFEPFKRLHPNHRFEGAGLGLAVCRKVAVWLGGTIYATGVPLEGASFHVVLKSFQK